MYYVISIHDFSVTRLPSLRGAQFSITFTEQVMKTINSIILSLTALCISSMWSTTNHAAGLMTPTGSNLPQLEIRQHHVNVVIEDGYAITSVEQVFANPHASDLEAV